MRLPRDIPGAQLAKSLARFGYSITRQTGSHIRLTIPAYNPLRVGTLDAIISDVASHLGISKNDLLNAFR